MKNCLLFALFNITIAINCMAQKPEGITIDSVITHTPPQRIFMVEIPGSKSHVYTPDIVVSPGNPKTNSEFGNLEQAAISVNGSFFDTKTFEMVTYYEENNIAVSNNTEPDPGVTLFNGILIIDQEDKLRIMPLLNQEYYRTSKAEKEALAAGPLLLLNGKAADLPARPGFTQKRHPRSCLCITDTSTRVIVVDGRREQASGMTLPELQEFLIKLGCTDALNLDGGGSSSLWVNEYGILNHPSDTTGERKVVNAIVWKFQTDSARQQ